MLIPSLLGDHAGGLSSLSRGMNANSQLNFIKGIFESKSIKMNIRSF